MLKKINIFGLLYNLICKRRKNNNKVNDDKVNDKKVNNDKVIIDKDYENFRKKKLIETFMV